MPRQLHIGLDQAFTNSGYSLLEFLPEQKKAVYLESGVFHPSIKLGSKADTIAFFEHLNFLKKFVAKVKEMGELNSIAVEGVAIGAMGASAARGGIFGAYSVFAAQHADLIIVSPTKLKSYITGSGSGEKEEISALMCKKYGINRSLSTKKETEMFYNETDAIALCEVGMQAWRVMHKGIGSVKKELTDNQYRILWSSEKVQKKSKKRNKKKKEEDTEESKLFGICNRVDDFYIFKRVKEDQEN